MTTRRLPFVLCLAALAGCAPRTDLPGTLDVRASYDQSRTERPTLPRCYHGHHPMGERFTPADLDAVRALRIGILVQSDVVTAYRPASGVIAIEPWMPRAVLLHEVCHAGQLAGHHDGEWQREAGAMVAEVAALQAEGWSDDRIRDLSSSNGQSPAWIFAWIRAQGPQITGTDADIPIAYEWGKSDAVWASVGSLMGPAIAGACPANWSSSGTAWASDFNSLGLMP